MQRRVDALGELLGLSRTRVEPDALAEAGELLDRIAERRRLSLDHTVVALAGPTGSGKSALFNMLTGLELSEVGVRRPTTEEPVACAWDPRGSVGLLDRLGIAPHARFARSSLMDGVHTRPGGSDTGFEGLILLDLPDHDSATGEHRRQVDRMLALVDVVVWVVDPEKYADALLHERYLRPLAGHADVTLVVLNQADRLPYEAADQVLDDLRRLLDEDGLAVGEHGEAGAVVLRASALTGEGVADVRAAIGQIAAERGAANRRVAADIDHATTRLRPIYVGTGAVGLTDHARETFVGRLAEAVGAGAVGHLAEQEWAEAAARACGVPWGRLVERTPGDAPACGEPGASKTGMFGTATTAPEAPGGREPAKSRRGSQALGVPGVSGVAGASRVPGAFGVPGARGGEESEGAGAPGTGTGMSGALGVAGASRASGASGAAFRGAGATTGAPGARGAGSAGEVEDVLTGGSAGSGGSGAGDDGDARGVVPVVERGDALAGGRDVGKPDVRTLAGPRSAAGRTKGGAGREERTRGGGREARTMGRGARTSEWSRGAERAPLQASGPRRAASRALVAEAVRTVADQAAHGLPAPWALAVHDAARRGARGLPEVLDEAVAQADGVRVDRPRWWSVAGAAQWLLMVLSGVGTVGLVAVAVRALPVPVWLAAVVFGVGTLGGPALAWACRVGSRGPARRHGQAADRLLRDTAAHCGRARVLEPVAAELLRYAEVREQFGVAEGTVIPEERLRGQERGRERGEGAGRG